MSKWWKESYVWEFSPMLTSRAPKTPVEQANAKTAYCVRVCQFTFRFASIAELQEAVDFYSRKTHPSSRLPDKDWILAAKTRNPEGYRDDIAVMMKDERFWLQRWFEKVPLRLQREENRVKVLAALQAALQEFSQSQGHVS